MKALLVLAARVGNDGNRPIGPGKAAVPPEGDKDGAQVKALLVPPVWGMMGIVPSAHGKPQCLRRETKMVLR